MAQKARDLDLSDIDAVVAEMRRLFIGGYEQRGQWDLARICRHCSAAIHMSLDGYAFQAPWVLRLLAPLLRDRIKASVFRSRRITPGIPAPGALRHPAGGDEAEALAEYELAVERLKSYDGPLKPHPVFGVLSKQELLEFHTIHAMHHLSFLLPGDRGERA